MVDITLEAMKPAFPPSTTPSLVSQEVFASTSSTTCPSPREFNTKYYTSFLKDKIKASITTAGHNYIFN
ncbi:10996_t:CDS:2 [Ambispora leptoticha]|uniref:10996_t:CDS:1 n=1 Tax=Ambispora leptoticha TaxID=144679 RepID=A0A9N8YPD3_9GLOM|nr:10996_t:CDS:2 [Ambispora leptoticha]